MLITFCENVEKTLFFLIFLSKIVLLLDHCDDGMVILANNCLPFIDTDHRT